MTNIIITYVTFSHLVGFTLAYFMLDQLYLKNKINYVLVPLIMLLGIYVGSTLAYIDTLILFLFFFFLSIKNSSKKNVAHSLLVVSTAYFLEMMTTELFRPLFFQIIAAKQFCEQIFLLFLILATTISIISIVSWLINKWVFPSIRGKNLSVLSYLLTMFLLAYQTYGLLTIYIDNIPLLKDFILIFYGILIALIISVIKTFSKNEILNFQAKQRELEYDMMSKYSEEVKKQYQEIQKFRHDYINILSSIEYYLDHNKIAELKRFYHTNVKQTKTLFKTNILRINDLEKIESLEIRSIVSTKLITAQEKNIDVQIEVNEKIPVNISLDSVILIRILGILLDNAIDELESLKSGSLLVGIFIISGDVVIIIQNTVRENVEPLHLLKKEGFSTRGNSRGLGLSNVQELILLEPQLLLETIIENNLFIQKITIMKG